ncbi:nodulation protein H-like isoform X2 [Salvia splendens]|uniref:nodulation protein H-like isoform X2 n=1 Tax=Salvia splendens TaxID=180675 RepID=UPI001C276185|nr:nodulation protein H-like isoform X2 [Salvia splendens]
MIAPSIGLKLHSCTTQSPLHLAECASNPVRLFAILSMQRSGSGWFETLLNNHTNVSSNGEIFSIKERRSNASSIISTLDRVYNLDMFTSASKNECSAAVGFKWMLNQGLMAYHKEIADYFNDRGVSVIFLVRRNLLRRMVSVLANSYDRYAKLLNGMHKSHVHSHEEADTLSKFKPEINTTSLVNDLKVMEKMVLEVLEYFSRTRHIILYYEDLIKNQTKLMDVQRFLGLPVMDLSSRQVKIHRGSLSEHIKNWDDVDKILRGTVYESFLHTDYSN